MGKYDPLRVFLTTVAAHEAELTLTFQQIESILGFGLPFSAYQHRAWWANPSTPDYHPYAQAWLGAGWKVDTVNQEARWVRFRRLG
jgi:hypothetical protein